MNALSQTTIDTLIKTAQRSLRQQEEEDFNVYDCSGGNFDDAYSLGYDDAEVQSARSILTELGISFEKK